MKKNTVKTWRLGHWKRCISGNPYLDRCCWVHDSEKCVLRPSTGHFLLIWCAKVDKQEHICIICYTNIQSLFWTDEKIDPLFGVFFWIFVGLHRLSRRILPLWGYILFHLRNGEASKVPAPFPDVQAIPLRKRSACFALSNERLVDPKKCGLSLHQKHPQGKKKGITKHQFWLLLVFLGVLRAGESHLFTEGFRISLNWCKISSNSKRSILRMF